MKYRIVTFLVFGAAVFWLTEQSGRENQLPLASHMDSLWLDFCMANSSHRLSDAEVTMVRIGDDYEPALPSEELTRLDYAVLLANIEKFNPASIAIVTPMAWAEPNVINQKALQSQVEKMPLLTLGAIAENSPVASEAAAKLPFETITQFDGDIDSLTRFTDLVAMPEKESLSNGTAAVTKIELSNADDEGALSSIPLIARYGDSVVPTFVLQALLNYEKLSIKDLKVELPSDGNQGMIRIGEAHQIPVDSSGHMKIYRHADIRPPLYQVISANELALAHSQEPEIKALQVELEDEFESLTSNLIVIGLDREADQHISWDREEKISLTQVLVRSIAVIQSGRYIEQWSLPGRLAGFAVIALLTLWIYRLSRRRVLVWGLLFTFLYFGACVFLFHNTLLWTPPFAPLALFATLILIGIILPNHAAASHSSASQSADAPATEEESDEPS